MDKKLLSKAVFVGVFVHIIIIVFYATYRGDHLSNHYLNYVPQNTQGGLKSSSTSSSSSSSIFSYFYQPVEREETQKVPQKYQDEVMKLSKLLAYSSSSLETNSQSFGRIQEDDEVKTQNEKSDEMKDGDEKSKDAMVTVATRNWDDEEYDYKDMTVNLTLTMIPTAEVKPSLDFKMIYNPSRTLTDTNHPQFNRAFNKNTMPHYLFGWKPSPDSPAYFREVDGATTWMYSAFLVDCVPPSVRLIGLSVRYSRKMNGVFCHFLDEYNTWKATAKGSILPLKDNHMLEHSAAAIECVLPEGLRPAFVRASKFENYQSVKSAPIKIERQGIKFIRNFTLCFSPLHSFYNDTYRLIQSIELNKQLGASNFFFYNFSTTKETDEVLRYYERDGFATILQWPLPHLKSWYYGQVAAINDCIYRNRIISRYVVIVDMDEFIIPNNHSSWLDLINAVIQSPSLRQHKDAYIVTPHRKCVLPDFITKLDNMDENETHFGSFMFRCAFFAANPLSDKETTELHKKIQLSQETSEFFSKFSSEPVNFLKRNDVLYDYESRSKLIVRPETVVSHAIHKTVEHILGYETAYVDSVAAFMHHYRPYKIKDLNTLDTSALKFRDKLYTSLKNVMTLFPNIFGNISINIK